MVKLVYKFDQKPTLTFFLDMAMIAQTTKDKTASNKKGRSSRTTALKW